MSARLAWEIAGVLALALLAAAPASASSGRAPGRAQTLALSGGPVQVTTVCGRTRRALVVAQGARAAVRVRVRRARRALLAVSRCRDGRWSRLRLSSLRKRRSRRALPTDAAGDVRVRLRVRGRTRFAYVHVTEDLVDVPVRFRVANVNRSKLACQSDGATYTIAGRLTAPRRALGGGSAVTLYLHEFSFGQFFWAWPEERYDYGRALARAGHASVAIDRLGYDNSSRPAGTAVCLGSQADIAHQVIGALERGDYSASGISPARFSRVALAGHSVGGAVAEVEAYSFGDADALLLFAQADQDFKAPATVAATREGMQCAAGGQPAEAGGPGGYAYFSQSDEEFRSFQFRTAETRIADAVTARRNPDPCGDVESLATAIASNQANVGSISVPVLLLYGTGDAVYEQPQAGEDQRRLFSGSQDVTLRYFADQAHGLTFESKAAEVRDTAADWLARRGF